MIAGARVVHVVGARPNFMKAAPVISALRRRHVEQRLIHTGQHYDAALSDVFFAELGLPEPDVHLGVGPNRHAQQLADLLLALDRAYTHLDPSLVVVYGDVTSTMAAALTAAGRSIPVAHVEAGLRSFDTTMPEELNRKVADLVADLLFVTAPEGLDNLAREGAGGARVHFVGNPMIDSLMAVVERIDPAAVVERLGLPERYAVATVHRPSNVDAPEAAAAMVRALRRLAEGIDVVLPLHPRGRPTLEGAGILNVPRLRVLPPMGYGDFIALVRRATVVVTDSGGIQEETTVLGVPCLTMRPNTERPITISHGTNRLVTPDELADTAREVIGQPRPADTALPPLWDGRAGERIAEAIVGWLARRPTVMDSAENGGI